MNILLVTNEAFEYYDTFLKAFIEFFTNSDDSLKVLLRRSKGSSSDITEVQKSIGFMELKEINKSIVKTLPALFGINHLLIGSIKELQAFSPDVIFARDNPVYGLSIAREFPRTPFVFQYTYPFELETSLFKRLLMEISYKKVFNVSDLIFPISKSLGKHLHEKFGVHEKIIKPLPMGVCTMLSERALVTSDRARIRKSMGVRDTEYLVVFAGSVKSNINLLRKIAEELQQTQSPKIRLLVLVRNTPGTDYDFIRNFLSLENVILKYDLPIEKVMDYYAASDIGLNVFVDTAGSLTRMATKNLEYLAMGLPLVTSRCVVEDSFVSNNRFGIEVENNEFEFSNAIITVSRWSFDSKKAIEWIKQNYSYDSILGNLKKDLLSICRRKDCRNKEIQK